MWVMLQISQKMQIKCKYKGFRKWDQFIFQGNGRATAQLYVVLWIFCKGYQLNMMLKTENSISGANMKTK